MAAPPIDHAILPESSGAGTTIPAGSSPGTGSAEKLSRRRKVLLLALLALLALVLTLFGAWYLTTRKPITEIPIPGIVRETLPHYVVSGYGITQPIGIAVNTDGSRIYVAETEGQRAVAVYDGKGEPIETLVPPDTSVATRMPVYVAIDPLTDDVYVTDRQNSAIYVFDASGKFLRDFAPKPAMPTFQPLGLTFDAQGLLYVSDIGGAFHRIVVFNRDGTVARTIGQSGQFSYPNGLAVDSAGHLFVADGNNGRLLIFDSAGRQVAAVSRGSAAGQLGLPRGVSIDDSGRIYVADTTSHVVDVYRLDPSTGQPRFLGSIGAPGPGDAQFQYPNGVATDSRGHVYVADWGNNRFQVWTY